MPDLYCILNHELTEKQKEDAVSNIGVDSIYYGDKEVKYIWSNIKPEGELDISSLNKIVDWLKDSAKIGDYVLVQGEFGATFYIVDFCFKNGLIPVYATSKREYREIILNDGSIERKHIFNHVQFRRYKRFMEG